MIQPFQVHVHWIRRCPDPWSTSRTSLEAVALLCLWNGLQVLSIESSDLTQVVIDVDTEVTQSSDKRCPEFRERQSYSVHDCTCQDIYRLVVSHDNSGNGHETGNDGKGNASHDEPSSKQEASHSGNASKRVGPGSSLLRIQSEQFAKLSIGIRKNPPQYKEQNAWVDHCN